MASRKLWLDVDMHIIHSVVCHINENPTDIISEPRCREFGIPTSLCRRIKGVYVNSSGKKVLGVHAIELINAIASDLPIEPDTWRHVPEDLEAAILGGKRQCKQVVSVLVPAICEVLEMEIETIDNMVRRRKGWRLER